MSARALALVALLPALTLSLRADEALPPGTERGLDAIRPEGLRSHLRFLADDLLEGRRTAARGHVLAARYVASQLETFGFEPAGSAGWEQPVPLRRARVDEARSALRLQRGRRAATLKLGEDYVVMPRTRALGLEVEGDVVFVGYGIHQPRSNHDDYAGIDVRGKVVALVSGAPANLPPDQRAHLGTSREKARAAEAHGAVGMLFVHDGEGSGQLGRMAAGLRRGRVTWADPSVRAPGEDIDGIALLGEKATAWIFDKARPGAKEALERVRAGQHRSFALGVRALIRTTTEQEAMQSPNVVGRLPGSDPALSRQAIVISAHLDHLGISEQEGDGVFNGALDNASGSAALLEMARGFAELPIRPRRSIVVLAATGEELGLLGSDYFAHHPTLPISDIVANVNLDLLPMLYPPRDVVAYGAEHSSLAAPLERAARHLGLKVSPDPWPEQSLFVRSDQYSFVQRGVPAMFLAPGFETGDPERDGEEIWRTWLREVYHSPKDDLSQPLDADAGAIVARLGFLVGLLVADADERPHWNEGDFFAVAGAAGATPAHAPGKPD